MTVSTLEHLDLITGTAAQTILRKAEKARLPADFSEIVDLITAETEIAWKPFGSGGEDGGRIPHSALGAAADPALLLAEPVMNSFDALFELKMLLAALSGIPPKVPSSPREAAHLLFGIPDGGLAAWDARKGDARKSHDQIAALTQVILRLGSQPKSPTIAFVDQGVGQHPQDFWSTILSLQLGNKADISYTSGQYGHGAGMLLTFSEGGQIMVSRRHPKLLANGQEDYVGLALVRKRMPSQIKRANPRYEVLVSKRTSEPVAFAPSALTNPQWYGLQRICIDYELPKPSFQFIYDSFDQFLPHPPLPYELRDERND
jgi:hypothetical protein